MVSIKKYTYDIKVINAAKKSEYTVKRLDFTGKFLAVKAIKAKIAEISENVTQIGYILPGHGLKGRQYFLTTDDDLSDMYVAFKGKHDILLWCWYSDPKNESVIEHEATSSKPSGSKNSKKESISRKITNVEEIVSTLRNIHNEKYSVEQLNAWAHMLELKKHDSYDMPPNLPYFKKRQKALSGNEPSNSLSPCKRIKLRSECIDQLNKWHDLLEKGGINKEQYDKLQKTIMDDML